MRTLRILLLMSAIVLAQIARVSAAVNTDTSTLYVAYIAAPATLDPAVAYDGAGPLVLRGVYDSLLTLDGSSATHIIGDLATHWVSSPDKMIWTFQLRHGVRFHDGTPVDAEAVKASIVRTITINQAPAYIMGQFLTPARIHVLSPYIIQFDLLPHSPVYSFLIAMTSQWGNWIVSPTAVKKHTVKGDDAQGWLSTHEAGSGPYTLTNYQPNLSATLTAFPEYWAGWAGHHVQRVVISNVAQDSTRRELLEKDGTDLSLSFTPQDLLAMQHEKGLIVANRYVFLEVFIQMTEYGPLASAAARQAMAYAYDYRSFNTDLLKGFGKPASGPLPATVNGHDPALGSHPTNLAEARTLLAKAGLKPGTTLTLWYTSGDERAKQMSEVLQGQLAQLGLVLKIEERDNATFSNMIYGNSPASQRPNFIANFWQPDYNDGIDYLSPLYHSKGSSANGGGSNAGDYHNATVDRLLEQAASTLDATRRQDMLNQAQQILTYTDPACIFVADVTENPVYNAKLHGFAINAELNETYDFYQMWKS